MTTYYGYLSKSDLFNEKAEKALKEHVKTSNIKLTSSIKDDVINKETWRSRDLFRKLMANMKAGDTLVVYESSSLACSTTQILEVLEHVSKHDYQVYFVKYKRLFTPGKAVDSLNLIQFLMLLKSDFVAKRTTDIIARRRRDGLHIGRPQGSNNKKLKLDDHRDLIENLLNQNVTRASIAKRIGCPAQTLYNYLEKRGIAMPG